MAHSSRLYLVVPWSLVVAILILWPGLAGAQPEATRSYPASQKRLEAVVREVLKERTLTLHITRFRPVLYLPVQRCGGDDGGVPVSFFPGIARASSFNCFTTWVDLNYLKISYRFMPKGEKETILTFQFEPNSTSKALIGDLEVLREDILEELHTQVSFRLPSFRE